MNSVLVVCEPGEEDPFEVLGTDPIELSPCLSIGQHKE